MSTIEQEAIVADLQRKLAERDAEVERLREYVREADRRVGEQFMAAQRAEAEALRLLNRCGEAFDRTRAAERAREEARILTEDAGSALRVIIATAEAARWPITAEQMVPLNMARKEAGRIAAFLAASGERA